MSTLIDRDNELKFLKNMTDDQAYANALSDPDNPPLTEEQLATVVRLRDVPGETLLEKVPKCTAPRKQADNHGSL